ncbi:MAG: hypothetical protein Q8P70_01900 [bacterium]|nr:hypothetical protein [bacterium]
MKIEQLWSVVREIITTPLYLVIISSVIISFAVFLFMIPVILIPGNDVAFQMSLYTWQQYTLMSSLAILVGLNAALQTYVLRQNRKRVVSRAAVETMGSGFSGMFAGIVGVTGISCSACLVSLFALFGMGTGGAYFILSNQTLFLFASVGILVAILAVTLYRAVSGCPLCVEVQENKKVGS